MSICYSFEYADCDDCRPTSADLDPVFIEWYDCPNGITHKEWLGRFAPFLTEAERDTIYKGINDFAKELVTNGEIDEPYQMGYHIIRDHMFGYNTVEDLAEDYPEVKPDMTMEEAEAAIKDSYGNIPTSFSEDGIVIFEM